MPLTRAKKVVATMAGKLGYTILRTAGPVPVFHSPHSLRLNARRLEHLASLRIPVTGLSVLEVGAAIGDHSHYYIDRGCRITMTEGRADNLHHLRAFYPDHDVRQLNMDQPVPLAGAPFDVVHCYGLLYHLIDPARALRYLSASCKNVLLLETCVSFGDAREIHPVSENAGDVTQACSGTGCRPTRPWLFDQLAGLFEHVYVPTTQPNHEEFPIDWTAPERHRACVSRAVFVASRQPIDNEQLSPGLLDRQTRMA